jgi:subtilase family serine protease
VGGGVIADPGDLTNACYRVRVQVDPSNLIAESNENNNSTTAYLSIGGSSCQDMITRDQTVKAEIKLQGVPLRTTSTTPMTRVH